MYEGDDSIYTQGSLEIGLSGVTCGVRDVENNAYCYSKDFVYYASCTGQEEEELSSCSLYAARGTHEQRQEAGAYNNYVLPGKYVLSKNKRGTSPWTHSCEGTCPSGLVW